MRGLQTPTPGNSWNQTAVRFAPENAAAAAAAVALSAAAAALFAAGADSAAAAAAALSADVRRSFCTSNRLRANHEI